MKKLNWLLSVAIASLCILASCNSDLPTQFDEAIPDQTTTVQQVPAYDHYAGFEWDQSVWNKIIQTEAFEEATRLLEPSYQKEIFSGASTGDSQYEARVETWMTEVRACIDQMYEQIPDFSHLYIDKYVMDRMAVEELSAPQTRASKDCKVDPWDIYDTYMNYAAIQRETGKFFTQYKLDNWRKQQLEHWLVECQAQWRSFAYGSSGIYGLMKADATLKTCEELNKVVDALVDRGASYEGFRTDVRTALNKISVDRNYIRRVYEARYGKIPDVPPIAPPSTKPTEILYSIQGPGVLNVGSAPAKYTVVPNYYNGMSGEWSAGPNPITADGLTATMEVPEKEGLYTVFFNYRFPGTQGTIKKSVWALEHYPPQIKGLSYEMLPGYSNDGMDIIIICPIMNNNNIVYHGGQTLDIDCLITLTNYGGNFPVEMKLVFPGGTVVWQDTQYCMGEDPDCIPVHASIDPSTIGPWDYFLEIYVAKRLGVRFPVYVR